MTVSKQILHIVPALSEESSGPSYSVNRLCGALSEAGERITLAALDWAPLSSPPPYLRVFPLGLGPRRLGRSPAMSRWLKATVASGDVAVVHNHGMWQMSSLYPGWACRGQTTAKLVISPRGALSTWAFTSGSRAKRLFWPLLQRPALAGAACFHATADSERLDIRQMGFAQPVAVIPNGIDIPEPCFRAETHPRTLLYLGRLHRVKGLDLLLAAWAELQDRFPEWRLKIVGSDLGYHGRTGYECQLRSLATSLKLVRLEFAGELRGSDKLMAYREAQLFVLPSRSENFGIAVAEALAAGTPALVSKGAPWHGLEANGCGWWVDLDKVALIDGLAKAMSLSPDELKKMGQLGREWMSHDFSWPHIGNMMRQTYDWLAGRTPPPAFVRFD